jgi:hypothetical protein
MCPARLFAHFYPRLKPGKASLLFAVALALQFPTKSEAQIHSKLQWFDDRGEIIDLDWATSIQWVWSQERIPAAQVIINIPEQINLLLSDESQARFLSGVPDREGKTSNRTLVVDMDGPRKTIKLRKLEPSSESKEVGMTIQLSTETPNIIPSESCSKEGVLVEPKQAEANFLFLAASCKKTSAGLRITLETSNDALLSRNEDDALQVHSSLIPLVILIPKKTVESLKPESVMATIKAESQTHPPITTEFDLIYTKANSVKAETVHVNKTITVIPASAPLVEHKPWLFTAEVGMDYLGYQSKLIRNAIDPNELQFGAKLSADHSLFNSQTHFKSDLELPLFALAPDAHFPASGFYKGTARASLTVFDRGRIAFHVEPGVEIGGAYFRNRSDIGGMYEGPMIAALLSGLVGGTSNRTMSALFSFAPLGGRGIDPFLHSYDFSAEISTEIARVDSDHLVELVLRYRYLNFHTSSLIDARATELLFGIRKGF